MKLHLPHSLRTALLCAFSLVTTLGTSNTYAAGLHSQVGMVTYTDFGQNMGRYRVNGVNDLLSSIRTRDGGVSIYYQEGHDDFLLPHYMISYESQGDNGAYAAVGYNFIATVAHNGCQNPTFTGRYINGADSLHYYGVEYRSNIIFCLQPGDVVFSSNWAYDFKMTRLNKLITDVTTSDLMPRFPDDFDYSQLHGLMEYRAGSGTMSIRHLDRSSEGLTGAYAYVTGAVQYITTGGTTSREWDCFTAGGNLNPTAAGINDTAPLPFVGAAGDSGSPVWLWDDDSQSYLYLAAYQSGSAWFGQARGSINFAWDSLTKFDKLIDMEQGASRTVHIKGVAAKPGDREISDGTHTTRLHLGRVEDGRGNLITDYVGVKGDDDRYIHTWLNLAPLKDQASWFATNNKYYNVGSYKEDNVTTQRELDIEDLFNDSNLVFSASTETGNVVAVDEDADLGIGYLQFSINPESGLDHAEFTLQSNGKTADGRGGQRDFMVNSAGFVVEQGVDLRVKLTNTQWDSAANDYYYREWRKVGDGNLYLEGQGSNQIFLNVGGKGTTYLKETGGYAAYNVYAGSGATVVMESLDQIARDFTFGYNGGTLDIRGNNSMDWYRTNPNVAAQGFSINSFSEDSFITNSQAGTTLNLTYRQGGETEYLGSFVDTKDGGAVRIVFDAGFEANTILHSIHTNLHNAGSGITVKSGSVTLEGSNTVHAMGSATGRNTARYFSDEDWHYADMATDVLVQGGTFVLGSHARLKGNVTLASTGSLIIHEGVRNAYEYIEGGIRKEDTTTAFYRQFYGLKGNISTAEGSMVFISYDKATTAEQVYTGNITGGGDFLVSLGGGGATLHLSGESDISGLKELMGGGLVSEKGLASLGSAVDNDHAWYVDNDAYIAAKGATGDELLGMVLKASRGTLALTQAQETDLMLQDKGYNSLIVGALAGLDVHYGTEGVALATVLNDDRQQWLLGGGGGNLIVDFALQNKNAELVLGNEYTTGTVTLTNAANSIGAITFKGQVTLEYTSEAALGQADVTLNYTNRLKLLSEGGLASVTENSSGVVLVDKTPDAAFDLTNYGDLYLGAAQDTVLHAAPTVAAGSAYRFGGIEGVLTLETPLQDSGQLATDLIVDGQTFSGGVLELARAAGITGSVEVRGYDAERLPHGVQPHGDITLRLTEDNSLIHASGVTLEDGGILDLHGTSQTVRNLNTEDGSLVTSSTGGGVLTVVGDDDSHIAGVLDLYCVNKLGSGTMVLSGTSLVDVFDVQNGTLQATAAEALSGLVTVHGNGSLVLPGGTVDAILSLGNGAHVSVTSNATATLGGMVLEDGATATLQGGTLALPRQATIGSVGTTLILTRNANLTLSADEDMAIHSTIMAIGNTGSKVTVSGGGGDNSYSRVLDSIGVEAGSTLTLEQTVQETAPTYEIRDLSGQGTLVLSEGSYKDAPSFYRLTRDTEFAGTFKILGNTGYSAHPYMSHTLIQSDNALAGAQVQMQGWSSDSGFITLGIDTENASIKGLSTVSNNRSILMAGATTATTAQDAPVSSRRATLTITGSANNTFQGRVVGGASGTNHGLSIVMNGSGTQTFNGSTVVFNNVSALAGKLVLNSAGLAINEDVTVARGAQLEIHGGWNLNEGHTLHVAGDASAASAALNNALTLYGGTIDFSGTALNGATEALHVSSLSGNRVSVTLSGTAALQTGTYLLANGDWRNITVNGTASHPYYELAFTQGATGLSVTVTQDTNSYIWNGSAGSHDWSATKFGQHDVAFGSTLTAVFSDAAQVRQVNITQDVTAGELVFDSTGTYTLGGAHRVSASSLIQMGSGTADLGGRASINGVAGLADGTLVMHSGDTADSVSIGEKATLRLVDADVATGTVSGAGTLAIALDEGVSANLSSIGADGIGRLVVESGTAVADAAFNVAEGVWVEESGTLSLNPAALASVDGSKLHLAGCLKIDSASNYALGTSLGISGETAGRLVITVVGTATVEDAVALNLAEISIEGGTMLMKRNGSSERNIGTLSLAEGTEFNLYGSTQPTEALEFAALKLTGASATVSNQNNSEAMLFRSLSGVAESTTLNLVKRANSTKITIFEFGGAQNPEANFTGTINLSSEVGGSRRSAAVVLSDANVAAHAVVNLASASSGDAILGLGVNADTVNIAGLSSNRALENRARVFSGAVEVNADSSDSVFNGDGVDRELVITTAEGADYSYYGAIGRNINLTIGGLGTQRFIGEGISADLNLVGGETVLDLAQFTGHATVGTGAELRFEGAHTVVSNLIETDGSIRFTGNNAVLELADDGDLVFNDFRYRDIDGNESQDGNGFALGGSVQIFSQGAHASVDLGTASIVYQGNTLELGVDGIARLDAGDSHTYFVHNGVVTYDGDFAAKAAALDIETYHLETAPGKSPAELLVRDASFLENGAGVTGPGTLGLDLPGSEFSLNDRLSATSRLGSLHLYSGTYVSGGDVYAEHILLDGGTAFRATGNQSANITANANGDTESQTILDLANNTLSGTLTLAGDTTVTSSGGTLAANVLTDGHLLTTSGNMTINNTSLAGKLRVDSGTLSLNGNYGNLSDITIGSGATIYLTYGSNITNGVHMAMEGGSILSSVAGRGTSRLNIDVLGGTAEIQGSYQGNLFNLAGNISGNGTLKLGRNYANSWTVSATIADGPDEGDTLAVTVESRVTISGHNTYSGGTTLIDRELTVNSADALGTGGLTVNGGTLNINNGLSVASVGGTAGTISLNNGSALTITGNANASFAGSLADGANILMQGTGSQAFTTAASYGNVDVQSGTLSLNASALAGQVSVAQGAELQLSTDSPATLASLIDNDGTIRFTGDNPVLDLAADGPFVLEGFGYRDIDGGVTPDGNGFVQDGSVRVVNMGENASISGAPATVTIQDKTLVLGSDGVARSDSRDSHTYYVRDGVVTYDADFAAKAAEQGIETYHLETAPGKAPAELLVRDSAFLESPATIAGPGTLGIDLPGSEFSLNGRLSGTDMLDTLHLYSGTLNAAGTLNVTREAFVEESATLNSNTAAFIQNGASLHLAGNLTLNLSGSVTLNTSITGIDGHVGTLALTGDTVTVNKATALQVGTLDLRQGAMVVHRDGASVREIGTLKLGNNTTFSQNSDSQPSTAMEIGSLVMAGDTATLKEENNSGALAIRSLSHSGSGSATLNLTNSATSTIIATFYLGGEDGSADDFTGTINLSSTHNGSKRSAAIILNDANVAARAAVNLASAASGGALLGLGINAERVEIAGLSSGSALGNRAHVFSGGLAVNTQTSDTALVGDDTLRELAITTAAGTDYSYHGVIGRNINLTIGGPGIQRFIGENLSADLNLVGGETVLDMSQYSGHATVGADAELSFAGAHTVVSNLIETEGTVTLAGDNAVLELIDGGDLVFNDFCYRDIDGNESPNGNGFAQNGSVQLFNLGEHASVNLGTASIVYKGDTLELDDNGVAWRGEKNSRSYSVRHGKVTYDEAFASKAATLEMEGFILATALEETPAELEIAEALKDDILIHSIGNGGILRLGEGVSLSTASLDAQASTILAGSGRLELAKGDTTLPQGVGLGQDWTGTVAVSGISFEGGFTCAQLGTGQSWVELKGTSGYFSSTTIGSNLVLAKGAGNWAFEQNNGNDGTTVKFTGKLRGDGNIGRSNETGSTYTYEFSGDIHEWTGSFISRNSNKNKYTMFRVSGDATEVNANLLLGNPGATYNDFRLEVKNNARFNGRVEVNSITVDDSASATLAGNTSISKGIANSGTLTNVGTLELGNITSWSGALVNAAQGNVVITSKLTAGTIDNSGTITISDLMVGTDARYVDAHGQSSGNGFATSNLDVCAIGVIQNHGGTIVYGNRDVTAEVLGTGRVQDATAQTAYHVNSTDNTVSFSVIDAAADGALEHIAYADGTALKVDNTADGRHLHSSQLSGTGIITLQLQDGAVLEMDSVFTTKLEVASGASATLHVTENAASNALTGLASGHTLAIDGDSSSVLTLAGASSVQGNLLITHSTVKMGNVQSLGAYNRITSIDAPLQRTITVGEQGVLDVNGGETSGDVGYTVTLDGGTLTNTGGNKDYGKRQPVTNLILDSDSTVVAQKTFGLVASGHAATTLALNGNTLEKTGDGTFFIVNATVAAGDGGRIRVSEGMLNFNGKETGKRGTMEGTLELAGGNVAGHINLGGDTTFDATAASSDVTADIATNGHDVHFAGDGNISVHAHSNNTGENGSGAISGSGTIVKEGAGTTAISGSMSGFSGSIDAQEGILNLFNQSALRVQDVVLADGATVGAYATAAADEMNEATLTISGTLAAKGADGRLNANVVMEADSTLDVSATGGCGIALGSSLTIMDGGINLSESDFSAVAGLGYGESYVLFNGVDSLTLDQTTYTDAITPEMQVDAVDWFHGVEPEKYYVVYDGSNVGEVAIFCATPEPATSTLSLLALAALAARRRRK